MFRRKSTTREDHFSRRKTQEAAAQLTNEPVIFHERLAWPRPVPWCDSLRPQHLIPSLVPWPATQLRHDLRPQHTVFL